MRKNGSVVLAGLAKIVVLKHSGGKAYETFLQPSRLYNLDVGAGGHNYAYKQLDALELTAVAVMGLVRNYKTAKLEDCHSVSYLKRSVIWHLKLHYRSLGVWIAKFAHTHNSICKFNVALGLKHKREGEIPGVIVSLLGCGICDGRTHGIAKIIYVTLSLSVRYMKALCQMIGIGIAPIGYLFMKPLYALICTHREVRP